MQKFISISCLLFGWALAGCASAQTNEFPVQNAGGGKPGPELERLIELAKDDMAAQLNIAKSDIEVIEAASVTWPDSSIGCPRPGFQYLHVLTPGSKIVLRSGSHVYHYHSGGNRPPTHCKNPGKTVPSPHAPEES